MPPDLASSHTDAQLLLSENVGAKEPKRRWPNWMGVKPSDLQQRAHLRDEDDRTRFLTNLVVMRTSLLPGDWDSCRFPRESRVVVEHLFEFAVEEQLPIRILKGARTRAFFGKDFEGWVLHAICHARLKVEIILAEPPSDRERRVWHNIARQAGQGQLILLCLPWYDDELFHHILCGDKAYKIEVPHEQYDGPVTEFAPERNARFSFSDSTLGRDIKKFHRLIRQVARPF